ncbi:MAG: hypothetical protein MRQ07_00840 [Candidatus Midichloria sp.]|nr:hypothetical protein [Candidatus Midichloria sp.]
MASARDINGDGRDDVMLGVLGVDVFFKTNTCDIWSVFFYISF